MKSKTPIAIILVFLIIGGMVYVKLQKGSVEVQPPAATPHLISPSSSSGLDFYGRSTVAVCQTDGDCTVGGCNSEICQGKNEGISSICILPDKPTPKTLGYRCGCVTAKCQWRK